MGNAASGEEAARDGCTEGGFAASGAQASGEQAQAAASTPAVQYNVYNQVIDPRNNMPLAANQLPWPGQQRQLSTARAVSNIPKSGTAGTWVFPSPQMFFNALQRKGKGDDVTEADMDSVVSVHNGMNEMTWQQVLRWESLHRDESPLPKLVRFRGRPDDLTPRARMRSWMGGPLPFDRHDWYIERNGQEVRYVIDFYFDEGKAATMDAFSVDVRPALDSVDNALDRTKMGIYVWCARYGLPCPVTGMPSSLGAPATAASQ